MAEGRAVGVGVGIDQTDWGICRPLLYPTPKQHYRLCPTSNRDSHRRACNAAAAFQNDTQALIDLQTSETNDGCSG